MEAQNVVANLLLQTCFLTDVYNLSKRRDEESFMTLFLVKSFLMFPNVLVVTFILALMPRKGLGFTYLIAELFHSDVYLALWKCLIMSVGVKFKRSLFNTRVEYTYFWYLIITLTLNIWFGHGSWVKTFAETPV